MFMIVSIKFPWLPKPQTILQAASLFIFSFSSATATTASTLVVCIINFVHSLPPHRHYFICSHCEKAFQCPGRQWSGLFLVNMKSLNSTFAIHTCLFSHVRGEVSNLYMHEQIVIDTLKYTFPFPPKKESKWLKLSWSWLELNESTMNLIASDWSDCKWL